jgi:hypothetical protein
LLNVSSMNLLAWPRTLVFILAAASLAACDTSVSGDGGDADDGEAEGDDGSGDDGASFESGGGTSEADAPLGVWTMSVQYGPVGEAVSPTIPLQVELRADGTAYKWLCAGAPSDGSFTDVCAAPSRSECMVGSFAWSGTRWEFEFPELEDEYTIDEMGRITPGVEGGLLLSYINPTYSGALFTRIADASVGDASCAP